MTFSERPLDGDLATLRERRAPAVLVRDVDHDFELLDSDVAENLLLATDDVEVATYPDEWVPDFVPDPLQRFASNEFVVGMPGDGGVAWTRQTDPPVVLVKPRLAASPDDFVDFLIAEALVQIDLGFPEHFLAFFGERYKHLGGISRKLSPADVYQIAVALFDAYVGLHTREAFAAWEGDLDYLHAAWVDAGDHLQSRLSELTDDVASADARFPDATELACSAVKHDLEPPAPFTPLASDEYREHGAEFALGWAQKTIRRLK